MLTILPQWLLLLPLLRISVFLGYGPGGAMGVFFVSTALSAVLSAYIWHALRHL